jgi:hypothetical protein
MTTILVIAYLVFAFVFGFIAAPRICASIAADRGLNYTKWYFNTIIFNMFAVIYLGLLVPGHKPEQKRRLFFIFLIYQVIFAGAFLIDTFSDF